MELFVKTAELRNFGRAAIALNITASTLSRRIAGLERELGQPLIRRSTRSFVLTEAGQHLFERSRKLIEETSQVKEELSASFMPIASHVRAWSPSDLATTLLALAFAKFCRENSAVSLDIISTQGQPSLDRDRFDVAFAVTHQVSFPDSPYSVRPIGLFARMLYASKTYLKRYGSPEYPKDLEKHSCLRYLDSSAETHWRLYRDRRSQTISIGGSCASSSLIVSAQAAREHIGIAMLPSHLASHRTYGAGLVRVLEDREGARVNVFAVTADRRLPARLEELIRVVRAEFEKRLLQLEATQS